MAKFYYPVGKTKEVFDRDWYSASPFGEDRGSYFHSGEDENKKTGGNTDLGEPLYAVGDGEIVYYHAKSHPTLGFGKHMVLECETPFGIKWFMYSHCQEITKGGKVKAGQIIGKLGKSGVKFAHLHFSVFKVNPVKFGIDNIANTKAELHKYWEAPHPLLKKLYEIEESEPQVEVDKETFEKLVHNSGLADQTVNYLGLAEKADDIGFETVKKSLEARDGKLTSCKNELSTRGEELAKALSEVKNRTEQVSRVKKRLVVLETDKKNLLNNLKDAQIKHETELSKSFAVSQQLQSKLENEAKAKGTALNELAETKAKLENALKEQYPDLTFVTWLKLFLSIKRV